MYYLQLIPSEALREHEERLRRAADARRVNEIRQRTRIQNRLREAVLETLRLGWSPCELADEIDVLTRGAKDRLRGRPCCEGHR